MFVDPLSSDRIEQHQIDAARERRLASCADVKVVADCSSGWVSAMSVPRRGNYV
jgi:hypothetical protein